MKKSIKAIAAASAALALTFSCVPAAFAAEDVPAVQTEAESAAKLEFAEGKIVETPYNGIVLYSDNDGTVYYYAYDKANPRLIIYTLDENGGIKNSFSVDSYVNDNGEKITAADAKLKQCGDHLYLMYREEVGSWWRSKEKGNVIVKLDKELNQVARYKHKKGRSLDTNGEKAVYISDKGNICICDIDGSNLKTLYSVNKSGEIFEQPLNCVAIAGNYVGFQKRTGYSNSPDRKAYCGIIDIETGEITLKEQRSVEQVRSFGDNLIWYGEAGYFPQESLDIPDEVIASGAIATDSYMTERYKYYSESELYIFDGKEYSVLKTPNAKEIGYGTAVDSNGDIVTTSFDGKGHVIYRFYRGKKLIGEHTVSYKGYSTDVIGGGAITISYTGRDATANDWVGISPDMTDEEIEKLIAATPSVKDIMKSVTISYN